MMLIEFMDVVMIGLYLLCVEIFGGGDFGVVDFYDDVDVLLDCVVGEMRVGC